jgi:hypothetical protein
MLSVLSCPVSDSFSAVIVVRHIFLQFYLSESYIVVYQKDSVSVYAWHSRSCSNSCSSCYKGFLVTWKVVRLTAIKLSCLYFLYRASPFPLHLILKPSQSQKSKSCYDRRPVGQSTLVSSTHLGPKTKFLLLSDCRGFVDVRLLLWWEDGQLTVATGPF